MNDTRWYSRICLNSIRNWIHGKPLSDGCCCTCCTKPWVSTRRQARTSELAWLTAGAEWMVVVFSRLSSLLTSSSSSSSSRTCAGAGGGRASCTELRVIDRLTARRHRSRLGVPSSTHDSSSVSSDSLCRWCWNVVFCGLKRCTDRSISSEDDEEESLLSSVTQCAVPLRCWRGRNANGFGFVTCSTRSRSRSARNAIRNTVNKKKQKRLPNLSTAN